MTNPIILTDDSTDTWATNSGDVFTHKIGEFYKRVQNSSAYQLSTGSFAITVSERVYDRETSEHLESEEISSTIFVSPEHARLFALEILAELDRNK